MEILQATTDADMDVIRVLFREYENYLQVDLCFQSFEAELAELPGKYAPPEGALLMAAEQGNVLGCVALKKLEDGVCEMKRLYVRPDARGTGLGRQLAVRIIRVAKEIGYREMRLDTLDKLTAAIALYRSIGFRETDPYYSNPLPGVVYLRLDL